MSPGAVFLACCWKGLEGSRDTAALGAGLCSGDFNVHVERLPLRRKMRGKTAGEQFLPLTQGNVSPWRLCKYQSIKCPSERPFCCLLMAPGGAPVSSLVFPY